MAMWNKDHISLPILEGIVIDDVRSTVMDNVCSTVMDYVCSTVIYDVCSTVIDNVEKLVASPLQDVELTLAFVSC